MSGAENYAEALFSLSEENNETAEVLCDLKICHDAILQNPSYTKLTDTPAVSVPEKLSLINEAFGSVNESVRNLLSILCEKHSVYIFPRIVKAYISLYNESRGICPAEVISAVKLSDEQTEKIKTKLERATGKTIVIQNTVDPTLLGGIKLRYMGKQLDGSLKARLTVIENGIKNTIL